MCMCEKIIVIFWGKFKSFYIFKCMLKEWFKLVWKLDFNKIKIFLLKCFIKYLSGEIDMLI